MTYVTPEHLERLSQADAANNAHIGPTERRYMFLGDLVTGLVIPATTLYPREVYVRSSQNSMDTTVAVLSGGCGIIWTNNPTYFTYEVEVVKPADSALLTVVALTNAGNMATGGATPLEQIIANGVLPTADR